MACQLAPAGAFEFRGRGRRFIIPRITIAGESAVTVTVKLVSPPFFE